MQRLTEAKDLQSSKIHLLKLRRSSEQSDNERSGRPVTIVERYEMPIYVARLSILIISALVVTAILWASLSKIDVIAEAPGKVIPIGDVKQVQPAFDGVIEKVLVVEGEQVTKDQPLVVLDSKPYA